MSVDLKSSIEASGENPADFVRDPKHVGAVELQAAVPRSNHLWVGREAIPDNPHHGEVWRENSKRFTKSQQYAFLEGCSWLVEIPGVRLGR